MAANGTGREELMKYPKIYLAMDNCLMYKRWTTPDEWAEQMARLGIYNIEASADTELDPLFMEKGYLKDWIRNVRAAEKAHGVRVCNIYSGHGTYSTLGLTHDDERVREHMIRDWFFPMAEMAGELGCGLGFFAHAFKHSILQSEEEYRNYVEILVDGLSRINAHGGECGCGLLGIEQMYTPHQFPWRMDDTVYLLREVTERSGRSFYFTEDLGHHSRDFVKPEKYKDGCWLGSDRAFALADEKGEAAWDDIQDDIRLHPSLFACESDTDCYHTLENLGCYSPIIHLQQTNGNRSAHEPFTEALNREGIIEPEKVLRAIKKSYETDALPGMPERADELYLTLELFSGTTSNMHTVMKNSKISVDYWRRFIPEDGIPLNELV